MIKINGQEKRNLQEQVLKNKEDIEELKSGITAPSFEDITGEPSDNTNLNNALNSKVDKVTGKGLSSNDFTNADKSKLDGINMASKQDALTTPQLNAVNSGVTASDVSAIAALITQMATKSPLLEAGANITLTTLGSGKIQISATGGSGGGTWGTITGSLSNQTDLWNELQSKLNASAITAYRTASDQTAIDTALQNLVNAETARATYEEGQLQTAIAQRLRASNLIEGSNIDITVDGSGNVIIACSIEAMEFKGSVPTYNDLPTSPSGGDTYSVLGGTEANKVFTWKASSSQWIQTGTMFDQSLFYTKAQSDEKFATQLNTYSKTESDAKYVDADKTALTNQTKDTLFALVPNTNDTKVFYRVEFASSDAPPTGAQFLVEVHNTSTSSSEKYGYIIAKNRTSCYKADLNNNNWSDWKQIYSGVKDFDWTYLSIDTDNVSGGQWRICCKSGIVFIEANSFTLLGHGTAGAVNSARIGLGIPSGYEPKGIEVRGILSYNHGTELLQNCWISANSNELTSFKRQNQYTQCRLFISYPVF